MSSVEEKVAQSPKISSIEWGHIEVESTRKNKAYKDAKLFPGGSKAWDWNETGTAHWVGIQPADVDDLLEHGTEILILSRGYHKHLRINQKTIDKLEDLEIQYMILPTDDAVDEYNRLADSGKPVGALIHSTC